LPDVEIDSVVGWVANPPSLWSLQIATSQLSQWR